MVTHSTAFFRQEASLSYRKEIIVIEEEILAKTTVHSLDSLRYWFDFVSGAAGGSGSRIP
jgi:hypothetical protein